MLNVRLLLCGAVLLSGCDLIPRGAGLQSEVLAVPDSSNGEEVVPEFAVEPITRDNLATFLHWPDIDNDNLRWIEAADQPNTRIVTPGDRLDITIWGTEENGLLTNPGQRSVTFPQTTVSAAGTIFLPFVGDIKVSGMSPDRARARIETEYQGALQSPQVQLELTEGPNRQVTLVSGVSAPGQVTLPHTNYTILELIADGGGIVTSFNNPQVRLQRNGTLYGVSADRLLGTPRLNTTLNARDRVFVEEDERIFLSLGASGTEAVHSFTKDTVTALEALTIIGGVAESRADAKGILILRRYPARAVTADRSGPDHPRTVFTIDLTTADGLFSADQFIVQPGDLIYVAESPVTAAQSIFSLFGSVLGINNQLN
ncbi:polysaccharide export protein [Octadecabacter sp. CECT 8868]|uniref:polysaccharide biosynthesis/export family protein n=1 Tax=Octadecabacter algicola TaxID=2909342 RepID=UPI001F489889|nr:polysaccharide biosynthesis/export family protein [Octadecabacter algicola]MCF2903356.1 polysaccharide export protein [Octadecabacter algicola]